MIITELTTDVIVLWYYIIAGLLIMIELTLIVIASKL